MYALATILARSPASTQCCTRSRRSTLEASSSDTAPSGYNRFLYFKGRGEVRQKETVNSNADTCVVHFLGTGLIQAIQTGFRSSTLLSKIFFDQVLRFYFTKRYINPKHKTVYANYFMFRYSLHFCKETQVFNWLPILDPDQDQQYVLTEE